MRQVGTGKASASEPLTTCRNKQMPLTPGRLNGHGISLAGAVNWPGGVRHGGGASPVCGFCMERGKADADTAAGRRWCRGREGARRAAGTVRR
jgi:hypothetical protein